MEQFSIHVRSLIDFLIVGGLECISRTIGGRGGARQVNLYDGHLTRSFRDVLYSLSASHELLRELRFLFLVSVM